MISAALTYMFSDKTVATLLIGTMFTTTVIMIVQNLKRSRW